MTDQNANVKEKEKQDKDLRDLKVITFLFAPFVCFALASIIALILFPVKRNQQFEYVKENYQFLKSPPESYTSWFEKTDRRVVFIDKQKMATMASKERSLSRSKLAILYAAEIEAKFGKQEWLNEAYKSYALTEEELSRLIVMEAQYNTKVDLESLNSDRELSQQTAPNTLASKQVNVNEVLKSRNVLVAMQ